MKNMLIKVLSVVMALTMIMGAFATIVSAANVNIVDHKHHWVKVDHVDATCITPGYDIYECECGDARTQAVEDVLAVCSEKTLTTVDAVAPTCTTPGYLAYTSCTLCGKVWGELTIDPDNATALGHDWELFIVDPDCGVEGEIYGQCTRCGEKDVYENITACPGILDDTDNKYCSVAGHTNFSYVVTKQPTCTENGTAKYTCEVENCDAYVNIPIIAPGHNWQVVVGKGAIEKAFNITSAATCDANGYRAYECLYCEAEANDESEENKANIAAINAAFKADFTDKDGKLNETLYWAVAAGDLGAYAEINEELIDADTKVAYVGGHIWENLVAPGNSKCDCVLGYDADGDGKLEFVSGIIKFFQDATCSQEGYQWKHCVRDGCDCNTDTANGDATHAIECFPIAKKDDHSWKTIDIEVEEGGKKVTKTVTNYVYSLTYIDKDGDEVKVSVYAVSLKEAKKALTAAIQAKNAGVTELWNNLVAYKDLTFDIMQCVTAINGGKECKYCGFVEPVAAESVEATGHDYDKDDDGDTLDDAKIIWDTTAPAICDPTANHKVEYTCFTCGSKWVDTNFVVGHVYHFICDDADCDSNKVHVDEEGEEYFVDCKDCTHAGREYACKVCERYYKADKPAYKQDQHFDEHKLVITEKKVEYYTLEGIGKVYETCVLPARYVWACTNTNCDYTEIHFNPADFTKGDAIWEDLDNDGVLDFNEEGVTADDYAKLEQANLTEKQINDIQLEIVAKILNKISRGNANKVSTEVTAHRPYDEKSNNGVKYIAPTCKTNGSAIGFCTWCSKNINETLPKGEQYHVWKMVAKAVPVDCMTTGYTAKYECEVCGNVKGGEAIDFDPTKHSHVAGCTKELFKKRPASCTIEYSEVYVYSICGRYETVKAGQVNPTNHVYYDYDDNFNVIKITSFLKTVEFADPTCTTKGTHSFTYCTECNYVVSVDVNPADNKNDGCIYDDCRTYDADKKVWKDCASYTTDLNDSKNEKNHGLCAGNHCKNHEDLLKYNMNLDLDNKAETTDSKIEIAFAANADQFTTLVVDDFGDKITAKEIEAFAKINFRLTEVAGKALTDKEGATETTNNVTDAVFAIAELGHNFWFDASYHGKANTLSYEAWVAAGNTAAYPGRVLRVLLKETCTTPGHEWKIGCSRECCDYVPEVQDDPATKDVNEYKAAVDYTVHTELNGETVLPHGIEKVFRNDISKEATCLEGGMIKGLFCPDCPASDDPHRPIEDDSNGCAICEGPEPTVKAKGHDAVLHTSTTNAGVECLKYSVSFYHCSRCNDLVDEKGDYLWVGRNWIPAYEEHVYAKDTDGKTDVVVYVKETCTEDGYKYKVCTVCGEDVIVETIKAHGHRNVNWNDDVNGDDVVNAYDGDVITFDCVNSAYLINKGTDCDICGKVVAVDVNKNVIHGAQNGNIDHTWVKTYVTGGCLTDGGYSYICSGCGITKNDAVHTFDANGVCECGAEKTEDATGAHGHHDYGKTIKYVPATPEATGVWEWECRRCGAITVEKLIYTRDITFALSAEGVYSKTVVNGGKVEVTLSISTEYLTFNTFYHVLNFDAAKLSIADADVEFLFDFDRSMSQVNDGSVVVAAWYDFSNTELLDGEAIDVVKYVFDVAPGVSYIDEDVIWQSDVKVSSDVATYQPVLEDTEVEVALVGDLNGDFEFDADDVKLFSDIIKHNGNCEGCDDKLCGYNAIADVVYDGVIDSADWFAFTAFALSNQTIADYYAMFDIDVYAMIDAFEIDDYNGDDDITAKDRKIFNDAVLEAVEYKGGAIVTYVMNFGDFSILLDMAEDTLMYQ